MTDQEKIDTLTELLVNLINDIEDDSISLNNLRAAKNFVAELENN